MTFSVHWTTSEGACRWHEEPRWVLIERLSGSRTWGRGKSASAFQTGILSSWQTSGTRSNSPS